MTGLIGVQQRLLSSPLIWNRNQQMAYSDRCGMLMAQLRNIINIGSGLKTVTCDRGEAANTQVGLPVTTLHGRA
jgi:hypothetical protein